MKKTLLAVALFCGSFTAASAEGDILDNGIFNHLGVGVGIGLTGIDIEASAPITNYVQVRAGVSFFPKFAVSTDFDLPQTNLNTLNNAEVKNAVNTGTATIDNQPLNDNQKAVYNDLVNMKWPTNLETEASFNKVDFKLLFDVYPVPKWSFHFTAGFYVGKSRLLNVETTNCGDELQTIANYNDCLGGKTLTYGSQSLALPSFGVKFQDNEYKITNRVADAYLQVNGFKPYLGIGFGRAVPKKTRLAFACDMGCQFWGTPELYVLSKKMGDDKLTQDVMKIINKITVYPVLNFRLTGRIL